MPVDDPAGPAADPEADRPLGPPKPLGPPVDATPRRNDLVRTRPATQTDRDWPAQAADAVVKVVDEVRSKTVGPATTVARGLVYGSLVAILATVVLVMAFIGAIRLLDEALPSGVWLPYLVVGTILSTAGLLVFRRRYPRGAGGG